MFAQIDFLRCFYRYNAAHLPHFGQSFQRHFEGRCGAVDAVERATKLRKRPRRKCRRWSESPKRHTRHRVPKRRRFRAVCPTACTCRANARVWCPAPKASQNMRNEFEKLMFSGSSPTMEAWCAALLAAFCVPQLHKNSAPATPNRLATSVMT